MLSGVTLRDWVSPLLLLQVLLLQPVPHQLQRVNTEESVGVLSAYPASFLQAIPMDFTLPAVTQKVDQQTFNTFLSWIYFIKL